MELAAGGIVAFAGYFAFPSLAGGRMYLETATLLKVCSGLILESSFMKNPVTGAEVMKCSTNNLHISRSFGLLSWWGPTCFWLDPQATIERCGLHLDIADPVLHLSYFMQDLGRIVSDNAAHLLHTFGSSNERDAESEEESAMKLRDINKSRLDGFERRRLVDEKKDVLTFGTSNLAVAISETRPRLAAIGSLQGQVNMHLMHWLFLPHLPCPELFIHLWSQLSYREMLS